MLTQCMLFNVKKFIDLKHIYLFINQQKLEVEITSEMAHISFDGETNPKKRNKN